MNDLVRPALYEAWHARQRKEAQRERDVVGPLCETADYLGLDREAAVEDGASCGLVRGRLRRYYRFKLQYTPSGTGSDGRC
jgi:hypothetical protein